MATAVARRRRDGNAFGLLAQATRGCAATNEFAAAADAPEGAGLPRFSAGLEAAAGAGGEAEGVDAARRHDAADDVVVGVRRPAQSLHWRRRHRGWFNLRES